MYKYTWFLILLCFSHILIHLFVSTSSTKTVVVIEITASTGVGSWVQVRQEKRLLNSRKFSLFTHRQSFHYFSSYGEENEIYTKVVQPLLSVRYHCTDVSIVYDSFPQLARIRRTCMNLICRCVNTVVSIHAYWVFRRLICGV